jgi:hypothetical protein
MTSLAAIRPASSLWPCLALVLLAACSGGSGKALDASVENPPPGPPAPGVGLDAVEVGSCGAPATDDLYVSELKLSDCAAPHAMELAGRYTLTEATYPGHTQLYRDAYRDCQPIFEKYVGLPFWDSKLDILTITPSPSSWTAGDRTVTCMVIGAERAPLTTRARDSRR